jgi:hypothetical protein
MVRACDRCGTVCAADQEWCLNCGVRMTEASQRLPGLRTAGLVVALAVLLAGGAAAASYAALRGDARSAANVPADTTAAPVAVAPTSTAAPVVPITPTPTTTAPTATAKKSAPSAVAPAPSTPSAGTGSATADTGSSGSAGSTGSAGTTGGSGTGSTGGATSDDDDTDTTTTTTTTTEEEASGPIVFANGQGTIYDPDDVAADEGVQANAIDGSTKTSWTVQLNPGATSGLGYVLDFDPATALKSLKIASGTAGLRIKVLGTTRSKLPPDVLDNGWETIATERALKSGANTVPLKAVSGAKSKYRHVLVLFTTIPGTPATAVIREFTAVR